MRYYQAELETLPLDRLRQLQSERLHTRCVELYDRVPFYRQRFAEHGITPGDIKTINDIHKLPFTYKDDLRAQYPFGLFAVPAADINRIHCSSGTTGKPTVVGYTAADLKVFTEVVARSLVAAGCQPGMKLQNSYGYGLFTGGLGMHYGAEALGMTVIPTSGGMTDRQLMLLQDFGVDAICCTPSYAQTLAEEVRKRGLSMDNFKLQLAILGAEPWTEAIRSQVEAGLGVNATNIYGLSEIIGPGVSQEDFEEKGSGSYIWEDHFYPEVVDKDTGEPLPEGELGVLVFTTLTKVGMPLLRYWTNDITNIYYTYSDKRTHVKMGPIRGRADDMLIIRGVNVFPTQIEELMAAEARLTPYYQLEVSRSGTLDEVLVRLEAGAPLGEDAYRELSGQFRKKIKDNVGITCRVEVCAPGSVPRSEGGKLQRVIDLR